MSDPKTQNTGKPSDLRRRAEEINAQSPENTKALSPEETQQVLHELRVHQIELEMQNEELRTSHAELETARTRYLNLYDLAPVGYCTVSEDGLILDANLTASVMLDLPRGALVTQYFGRFIFKEDQDIYYLHRNQIFKTKEPQSFDLRMLKKDATVFWAHLKMIVIQDDYSRPSEYRVVLSDVTERKQLEAEKASIEMQNRQLQKAESLGRMSGAIAHHFNNELNVVMGYLEMVIWDLPPGDPHAEKLARAMQSAQKASEVSGNLLAYLGQIRNKVECLDLSEICTVLLPVLLAGMPKNVALETDLPAPGPYIRADAKQIQQILTNLVINAWEAIGEETGTVRLSVKTVPAADIPASHRFPLEWQPKEQCYACMEVTDSGCGIQGQDIEKIFDPFFSTKFTGRGLGLSIVLGIAKTHGAAITVENRLNGGSVFRVFFPLSVQIEARQNKQIAKAPEIAAGGTILLVEDEAALREMTRIALVRFGFTVFQAKDGIEAVEIFGQHKDEISCLFSDLTMPRMGGWETISALRAMRSDLPVVLASGYDEATVMKGEHSELPDFFLNKPYDINKLGDTIGKAIARRAEVSEEGK